MKSLFALLIINGHFKMDKNAANMIWIVLEATWSHLQAVVVKMMHSFCVRVKNNVFMVSLTTNYHLKCHHIVNKSYLMHPKATSSYLKLPNAPHPKASKSYLKLPRAT